MDIFPQTSEARTELRFTPIAPYDTLKEADAGWHEEKIGKFTGADVVASCPSIGRSSALAALKKLTEEGLFLREGSGRSTFYVRADSK